jgi:hypothetical protein
MSWDEVGKQAKYKGVVSVNSRKRLMDKDRPTPAKTKAQISKRVKKPYTFEHRATYIPQMAGRMPVHGKWVRSYTKYETKKQRDQAMNDYKKHGFYYGVHENIEVRPIDLTNDT